MASWPASSCSSSSISRRRDLALPDRPPRPNGAPRVRRRDRRGAGDRRRRSPHRVFPRIARRYAETPRGTARARAFRAPSLAARPEPILHRWLQDRRRTGSRLCARQARCCEERAEAAGAGAARRRRAVHRPLVASFRFGLRCRCRSSRSSASKALLSPLPADRADPSVERGRSRLRIMSCSRPRSSSIPRWSTSSAAPPGSALRVHLRAGLHKHIPRPQAGGHLHHRRGGGLPGADPARCDGRDPTLRLPRPGGEPIQRRDVRRDDGDRRRGRLLHHLRLDQLGRSPTAPRTRRSGDRAVELGAARADLERTNAALETRVSERTAELREANAALHAGEALLRATIESTADGILVSMGRALAHINARFIDIWSIGAELSAPGATADALLDHAMRQVKDPDTFVATIAPTGSGGADRHLRFPGWPRHRIRVAAARAVRRRRRPSLEPPGYHRARRVGACARPAHGDHRGDDGRRR